MKLEEPRAGCSATIYICAQDVSWIWSLMNVLRSTFNPKDEKALGLFFFISFYIQMDRLP